MSLVSQKNDFHYTLTSNENHQEIGFFNEIANGISNVVGGAVNAVVNTGAAVGSLVQGNPEEAGQHMINAGQSALGSITEPLNVVTGGAVHNALSNAGVLPPPPPPPTPIPQGWKIAFQEASCPPLTSNHYNNIISQQADERKCIVYCNSKNQQWAQYKGSTCACGTSAMCDTSLKQTENGSTIYFNEPAITAWSTIVSAFLRGIEQATSSQAIAELRASLTVDLPQHISSFVDGRFQQLLNQEKAIEDAQRAAQLAAQNPSQGLTELDIAIQQAAVNGVDPNIIEGLRNQRSQLRRNTTKNSTVNAFNNLSDKKKILLIISSIILVVLISSLLFRPSNPKVIYESSDYTV